MQKISSYLYPNRIELLADLAGFSVEYTNVYQRNLQIYNGIDNTIEFDIKNADQKRIDLTTLSDIMLNVMDASGNSLPNAPYEIVPTAIKGIGEVTIPQEDLSDLKSQYLKYSVTAVKNNKDVILYANSKFGAVGTIELVGNALPTVRPAVIYKSFISDIDIRGIPTYHSSVIPVTYYEAIPSQSVSLEISVTGFVGTIWIDATENSTINVEAFRKAGKPYGSWTQDASDGLYTGIIPFGSNLNVNDFKYLRVSYQTPTLNGVGATFIVTQSNSGIYNVEIKYSGTGYNTNAMIKILGSQLGGEDIVNDLIITVAGIDGAGATSAYAASSITSISWSGTSAPGTARHIVSGSNYSGTVDYISVQ